MRNFGAGAANHHFAVKNLARKLRKKIGRRLILWDGFWIFLGLDFGSVWEQFSEADLCTVWEAFWDRFRLAFGKCFVNRFG